MPNYPFIKLRRHDVWSRETSKRFGCITELVLKIERNLEIFMFVWGKGGIFRNFFSNFYHSSLRTGIFTDEFYLALPYFQQIRDWSMKKLRRLLREIDQWLKSLNFRGMDLWK